ncbi:MAG: alpha/beta fold hydrolase [Actinomycetota bacterium]|nr:alpha/beta fold hydrolase [Actinomycetota bacterium]MDQ2957875.1 alpha/beta fold hydrolase [Actinomycetota bacterium]
MSQLEPHLHVDAGSDPEAVVLVLHGGRQTSTTPVSARQLAVLRMIPFARRIARHGHGRVAVARLRYRARGWNAVPGQTPPPVADAEWALDRLAERFGQLPVGLVGHSMGGRTALRVGGHPRVRGVVALAPWLPRSEPVAQLAGRQVLLVHGSADRMTDPQGSALFADRLEQADTPVSLVRVAGGRHAMLRRPRLWHELAAQFVLSTVLTDYQPSGWQDAPNFLGQVRQAPARLTY